MKKHITLLLLLITSIVFAQKSKVIDGKWKNLEDIKNYNLVFDYSDLEIPKYESEEAFLKDKMQKREDKNPGDGERFKKNWFEDRGRHYEPKFIESFNKRWKNQEIQVGKDMSNADYTIKIHTTFMYPGYHVGVWRQNSKIDAILSVFKNDAPNKILFSVKYKGAQGNGAFGHDYNAAFRISEAYAKLAKTFAANLKKKLN